MNDAATEVIEEVEPAEVDTEAVETEEITDEIEASEEGEPSESSTEKPEDEGKDKVQERIDEITKFRREEERKRIAAEAKARELEEEIERLKPKQPPGKKLADFNYDEEAFSEYVSEQAEERAKEAARESIQREKYEAEQAEFKTREDKFAEDNPDYFTVSRGAFRFTAEMKQVAMGSDNGPALIYHLAENPDLSSRLAEMSPWNMAREMGRLEATALSPKPKSLSKAPAPAPTLKAAAAATSIKSDSPDSDKLSTEEWVKREQKRMKAQNG